MTGTKSAAVAVLGLLLVLMPFLLEISNTDFNRSYYMAGQEVWETGTFEYVDRDFTFFTNLPILSYLFVPFGPFDVETAGKLFLATEIAAYLAAFVVVLSLFGQSAAAVAGLLFLFVFNRHYITSIQFGQLSILALLILALLYRAVDRKQDIAAGVLLSAAFLIKVPLGFLFFYFLYRRAFTTLVASMVSYLVVLAASLLLFGWQLHFDYVEISFLRSSGSTITAYNNPSPFSFAMRLLNPEQLFEWKLVPIPGWVSACVGAFLVLLIGFVARAMGPGRQTRGVGSWFEMSMVLCVSLLLFPVVWDHYYLFLLLPFCLAGKTLLDQPRAVLPLVVFGASLVAVHLPALSLLNANMGSLPMLGGFIESPLLRSLLPSVPMLGGLLLLGLLIFQFQSAGLRPGDETVHDA